jgi:hypothetical protein
VKEGEEVDILAFEDLNGNDEWWQCRNKQGEEGAVWVLATALSGTGEGGFFETDGRASSQVLWRPSTYSFSRRTTGCKALRLSRRRWWRRRRRRLLKKVPYR